MGLGVFRGGRKELHCCPPLPLAFVSGIRPSFGSAGSQLGIMDPPLLNDAKMSNIYLYMVDICWYGWNGSRWAWIRCAGAIYIPRLDDMRLPSWCPVPDHFRHQPIDQRSQLSLEEFAEAIGGAFWWSWNLEQCIRSSDQIQWCSFQPCHAVPIVGAVWHFFVFQSFCQSGAFALYGTHPLWFLPVPLPLMCSIYYIIT